ncbi:MAG: multidrug transporter AcrB [Steroidobacteraceae bacterium]|nr:multidrug transporter AcrB [Steroidobacteraceae bacterium]
MTNSTSDLGISGRIALFFLERKLTPLLALAALLAGVFAVLITPREEEPQIDVTFANVFVAFPGASAEQVENLVTSPMEKVLGEISGVEHIVSTSRPGLAVLGVQFEVGEARNDAIVRLYNAIYSNQDWQPPGAGVLQPLIKPKGIDDVPIVTLTLWSTDADRGTHEIGQVARSIETEIKRVPGTRNVYTVGDRQSVVHVQLDAQKLSGFGLTTDELIRALAASNVVTHAGNVIGDDFVVPVDAGTFLADRADVANLVVSAQDGKPVFLEDVATVVLGSAQPDSFMWFGTGAGSAATRPVANAPAVTIAISKKPGENSIDVADRVLRRVEQLRGTFIPEGIETTVTRNYGETANDKATKLIQKLLFATASVVLLVILTMGGREAIVVGAAILVTLSATLFASWAWGFTINRVSLFALIFSIGILVDDAIVVVENIHRHRSLSGNRGAPLTSVIARAVDEVGGPTILATFTVIAALLPMAFVSGLMGPYMSPIPINASMGMLISLAIALVFTPWMCRKLLGAQVHGSESESSWLRRIFERLLRPFLGRDSRPRRHWMYGGVAAAIVIAMLLVAARLVVMKMLPFDNKSEFQVIVNLPEGTTVETTARVLDELAQVVRRVPEVSDYQAYAGTAAPINFNGLVRQYYLRASPELGDLQVNLVGKHERSRQSHEIALAVQPELAAIGRRHRASVQVVEVPPGPPVLAPLVAEVYGPTRAEQLRIAAAVREVFDATPDISGVDDSMEAEQRRLIVRPDRQKAAQWGVSQRQITETVAAALSGVDATYARLGRERHAIPIRVGFSVADKADLATALSLEVRTGSGGTVPLSELVDVVETAADQAIYHKDLLPVVYVTGDMTGHLDSPLYGMFRMVSDMRSTPPGGMIIDQHFIRQPDSTSRAAIKWDGEWQITYETFRDMGAAYAVGLVLIYLLVVAQFGSYVLPLIIMAPIPLTIIGVMPGHALLGAQFTATSMIGMIALAGIIVRNSILLVDFIDAEIRSGRPLEDAVLNAGVVRAKPIALTGLAAMIGAFFILDDPIFNGLAVSLIFGILISTLLTLLVIPVIYYAYLKRQEAPAAPQE